VDVGEHRKAVFLLQVGEDFQRRFKADAALPESDVRFALSKEDL
jgi:hypothetical protein